MVFTLGPRARSSGVRLLEFDQIGSTNTEAVTMARAGERGPLWLVTQDQTAGRGRRHRPWISPRGNLAASVLEVFPVQPSIAATLGFAAGLAVDAALHQVSIEPRTRTEGEPIAFALKWPNDVLANGNKLSGIGLEAESVTGGGLAVVVGIGINVVAAPEGTPYPATSLAALGIAISAEEVFGALSDAWAKYRDIWDNGRGFGEIRRQWLGRAAGLGEVVSIQTTGALVQGVFDTIDENGCMILRMPNGTSYPVTAGDVHFGAVKSAGVA